MELDAGWTAALVDGVRKTSRRVARLRFAEPVACVYNPLSYARAPVEAYLERYARPKVEVLLLGMNPGPFGMVQTGVPFGEVGRVRDFLGIEEPVRTPRHVHPKRPIEGFACLRSEVSGARVWGWAESRFGTAEAFFERFFVWNWCPLAFLEESGRNRTPDKLPKPEREALERVCDAGLAELVAHIRPERLVGIGKVAEGALRRALPEIEPERIASILHPSPASPAANRGWQPAAERQLEALGIALPGSKAPGASRPVKRTSRAPGS